MCGSADGLNVVGMNGGASGMGPHQLLQGNVECRTLDKFRARYERASQIAGLAGYYDWPADHPALRAEREGAPGGNASPHLRMAKHDPRTQSASKSSTRASLDSDAPKGTFATSAWGKGSKRNRPRRITAEMIRNHGKPHASNGIQDAPLATALTRELPAGSYHRDGGHKFGISMKGIARSRPLPG